MIRFKNFRTPPFSSQEALIVLHGICNLLKRDFKLEPKTDDPIIVSRSICSVLIDYGIQEQWTSDFGKCSSLIQDLIDVLTERNILTLQDIEREAQEMSKQYLPVFYPSL